MSDDTFCRLDAFLASVERRALRVAEISTHDRDEALDIVQDAMLQLTRSYAHRPASEWPPLFYRILENKIRDWQRRQTVRRRVFTSPEAAGDDGDERDPIAQYADPHKPAIVDELRNQEAMVHLERALRQLPRRQREAFMLRVWEGLSVEQTATAMGCTDGSVKTHLSRALHALRSQLAGVWP
jgi:RNA polymerase sigma-70 factor (ECF subfamily)